MLKHIRTAEHEERAADSVSGQGDCAFPGLYDGVVPTPSGGAALRLLTDEYKEAYLSLARTGIEGMRQKLFGAPPGSPGLAASTKRLIGQKEKAPSERLSLQGEFPRAIAAYDDAVAFVRKMMAFASQGKLFTGPVVEVVDAIVSSLERNPDALLCLPRLRQRDAYTYTHCVNVAVLLAAFALHTGESREKALVAAMAGLFHDLGKALLPVSLLSARRTLSATEQALVTRHPTLGGDLLASLPNLRSEVLMAALEHHERYDGSGYPKGISKNAISRIGHLTAIADAYDAISSRRPYKGALFAHRTLGVMYQMRKKQFHPELMAQFVRVVGIYPVGSVVELKDGYRGVVTASNADNPMLPVVTLALDSTGRPMPLHACDLARESVARIARCLAPEISGIDPCEPLGLRP